MKMADSEEIIRGETDKEKISPAHTKKKSIIKEYVEILVVAFILAMILKTFVVQAFKIPTGSMKNTLLVGDHIFVSKFFYGYKLPFIDKRIFYFIQPSRKDIVVFRYPNDTSRDFIKRVIGLPGETLEVKNKEVYINGNKIDEPYVIHSMAGLRNDMDFFGPYLIPKGSYFMMGDNRDESLDSRSWGPLEEKFILGKAFFRYWPPRRIGLIR